MALDFGLCRFKGQRKAARADVAGILWEEAACDQCQDHLRTMGDEGDTMDLE
jgi:hypothetical protein